MGCGSVGLVSSETIHNCWKHTRVFPAPGLYELGEQELEYDGGPIDADSLHLLSSFIGSMGIASRSDVSFVLSYSCF